MADTLTIALLTLGNPARLTGGSLYQRWMADRAPAHEARVAFVSLPERRFPAAALAVPAILGRIRAQRADVLVIDSIVAASLAAWLAARSTGLPIVGMLHQPPGGIDRGRWRTALQRPLDLATYRRAGRLIVVSEALAAEAARAGYPRDRTRVVPPGRDPVPPAAPAGDLRQDRQIAVLCVANWLPHKGIHSLLDAVARLPPDAATLHLVGDDRVDLRYAARVRARHAAPDLADRVVVHGPQPPDRVAGFYAAADVFALPSTREAYGMVYAEALSAGLPLVGWHAGNLPYLVTDEREGLLAPPGDVSALAAALARLAADEPLRRRLGAAALARAQSLPNWDEAAAAFFAAIREVAGATASL